MRLGLYLLPRNIMTRYEFSPVRYNWKMEPKEES